MPDFDWNGNGESDAFDHFMDMKVMSSSSSVDSEELQIDADVDDTDDDIDLHRAAVASSLRRVYNSASGGSHTTATTGGTQSTSFQDELKKICVHPKLYAKRMPSVKEAPQCGEAQRTLETIKKLLLNKVQNAEYVKQNGVTSVSCTCDINYRYLRKRSYNNGDQLRENQKKSFLFRDPNLVYRTWDVFDVEPKYASEYNNFMAALKELASKENITIEPILLNEKNGAYPFPSTQDRIFGYTQLCVKATTIIAVDPNYKPPLPKHRHKFQKTPKPKLHKRSKTITQRP